MNETLKQAKKNKNDEFYTQLTDIEQELYHYRKHLKDKIIFCNCDDPEWSNFYLFFKLQFDILGLKKIITTHFEKDKPSYKIELFKENGELVELRTPLFQNGDFRSPESIELLKECDVVVTNPPFSLFREYIQVLIDSGKKFLIIGNQNAISYKEIFKYIKEGQLWLGYSGNVTMEFKVPANYINYSSQKNIKEGFLKVSGIQWFTNLEHNKRNEEMDLFKSINDKNMSYQKYDNYDAINIDKVKNIPGDYYDEIGVPITFLNKHNPNQFEITGIMSSTTVSEYNKGYPFIEGKKKYARIIIKRRKE